MVFMVLRLCITPCFTEQRTVLKISTALTCFSLKTIENEYLLFFKNLNKITEFNLQHYVCAHYVKELDE